MSKKQEKNNIQSVIEKEIKPIFNKIRRDSIAIINNESLVGDRRQQILEQLGTRRMSLKTMAIQKLVEHFADQMEEGELAINRNLKEQEEALNYRLQQRKSKNLHSVNPIEGIQVIESINNPDNEGLDSTYEDEINYQLEPNIEITEPIDLFENNSIINEIDEGINQVIQNMEIQLEELQENKELEMEILIEELTVNKIKHIEDIKNEFDPKIKENEAGIKQKIYNNLKQKKDKMIKEAIEFFEKEKQSKLKEIQEKYEEKKKIILRKQQEDTLQGLGALSSPSASSTSSTGMQSPFLLSPIHPAFEAKLNKNNFHFPLENN